MADDVRVPVGGRMKTTCVYSACNYPNEACRGLCVAPKAAAQPSESTVKLTENKVGAAAPTSAQESATPRDECRLIVDGNHYYRGNRSRAWFAQASRIDGSASGISERMPQEAWDLLERIADLQSELTAAKADAERYRWLRDKTDAVNAWDRTRDGWGAGCGADYLDSAIDAAMAAGQEPPKEAQK